jgi:hypothetical protein
MKRQDVLTKWSLIKLVAKFEKGKFLEDILQKHRSDIRNSSISQRCSKRSIFKYFKKIIIKIQRLENWPLYKVF